MNKQEFAASVAASLNSEVEPDYFIINPKTANLMGLKEGDMYGGGEVVFSCQYSGKPE